MLRYFLCLVFTGLTALAQTSWSVTRTNLPGVNSAWGVAFGNGRFVATTSGGTTGAAWSTDGATWHAADSSVPSQGSVAFVGSSFYVAASNEVLRSSDGATWQVVYTVPESNFTLRGIASDGTSFLVGNAMTNGQRLYFSADGLSWRDTTPVPYSGDPGSQTGIQALAYGAGRYFVSYVVQSASFTLTQYVASTTDGQTWTHVDSLQGSHELAGGSGRVIAMSGSTVEVSTDGQTFSNGGHIQNGGQLGFGGGRFFALDVLLASTDGIGWGALANVTLPASVQMYGVAYGNGRYVAAGWAAPGGFVNEQDVIAVLSTTAPPIISRQPAAKTVVLYDPLDLSVGVDNPDPQTTYQWRLNGTAIAGATAANYHVAMAQLDSIGSWTVTVKNTAGTTTSETAQVNVIPANQAGRLINVSVLATTDQTEPSFILGFSIGGGLSQTKPVLIRAAGPSLTTYGVTSPNPNPAIDYYAGDTRTAGNDDWGGSTTLADYAASVGAFPFLSANSHDAALYYPVAPLNSNSVVVTGTGGALGPTLAEVYEMTGLMGPTTPRLKNVSVRKWIPGDGMVTLGFVIGGTTDRTVLIRAVGPKLSAYGITNPLSDPTLAVFRQGATSAFTANDNWGSSDALKAAFQTTGAFMLDDNSNDSALLTTLSPGGYTVQVTSVARTAGIVLVEVYEVP